MPQNLKHLLFTFASCCIDLLTSEKGEDFNQSLRWQENIFDVDLIQFFYVYIWILVITVERSS